MAGSLTQLQSFLAEEVAKMKGVCYPVKAGFLKRVCTKKLPLSSLHPNPDDEFCNPEIGPNDEIISRYVKDYARSLDDVASGFSRSGVAERIIVEKVNPSGYMILNGHHRWAAAMKVGRKVIPAKIVNLTQEKDILKIMQKTGRNRRATLDLDEVVFSAGEGGAFEKPLRFPLNRIYRDRIRAGVPALLYTLDQKGYDIWVYTARYCSVEYIQYLFRHYHLPVAGIITGARRKGATERQANVRSHFEKKYSSTLLIDSKSVVRSVRDTKEYEEKKLSGSAASWSREAIEAIEAMKHE